MEHKERTLAGGPRSVLDGRSRMWSTSAAGPGRGLRHTSRAKLGVTRPGSGPARWGHSGIAACCRSGNPAPLGFPEGLNHEVHGLQRRAHGLGDEEHLRLEVTRVLSEL